MATAATAALGRPTIFRETNKIDSKANGHSITLFLINTWTDNVHVAMLRAAFNFHKANHWRTKIISKKKYVKIDKSLKIVSKLFLGLDSQDGELQLLNF